MRVFGRMRWSRGTAGVAGLDTGGSSGGLCRWRVGEVAESGVAFAIEAWWVGGDVGREALRYAASDGR